MAPLCARICPYPFFEATAPGAAPGPPVKTGPRLRRFQGCNYNDDAKRTKGMYKQHIQKAWGHTAHRGWAHLHLNRAWDLIITARRIAAPTAQH